MTSRAYLLSLPERVIRSALALGAGLLREVGEVVLPRGVRRSQLYKSLVEVTLRYVIERVGGAKGVFPPEQATTEDFLARRGAGHAIELLGIVAFRISPVWVLAALADVSGLGRRLIPEITAALEAQGLLDKGTRFESVDQLLTGLEKTSARLADTLNAPPLDIESLRKEWSAIRDHVRSLKPADRPSPQQIQQHWQQLTHESARQGRSVFEISSVMAVSAVRTLPAKARWLSASARIGASQTGKLAWAALLDHYTQTLNDLRAVGYLAYAKRQLSPYVRACIDQFSPQKRTLTQRLLDKAGKRRTPPA
jgi:hypothetical protein